MDQNQNNFDPKEVNNPQDGEAVNPEDAQTVSPDEAQKLDEELNEFEAMKKQLEETKAELDKEKREYLFLMAEFDNFRKRTLREKSEILRNGAESIVDDFERGLEAIKDTDNAEAVKEGMVLIYNKFVKYLEQNGVKAMESTGADFNDELHEAVALVPGQPEQKGKVIDTLEKGYMLNDKVLRHAKVAVGQ